jgi:hypothetical protein
MDTSDGKFQTRKGWSRTGLMGTPRKRGPRRRANP